RPMTIPVFDDTAIPPKLAQVLTVREAAAPQPGLKFAADTKSAQRAAPAQTVVAARSVQLSRATAKLEAYDRVALAGIVSKYFPCERGPLPGHVLRFQEYDRTAAELAGA